MPRHCWLKHYLAAAISSALTIKYSHQGHFSNEASMPLEAFEDAASHDVEAPVLDTTFGGTLLRAFIAFFFILFEACFIR